MIPKSGDRFSEKIMLKKEMEPHPDPVGMEQAPAACPAISRFSCPAPSMPTKFR
jgi:hypothetical protein